MAIALEDRGNSTDCEISWESADKKGLISSSSKTWQVISRDAAAISATSLKLSAHAGDRRSTRLVGLRLAPEQKSNWPWGFEAKVSALFEGESKNGSAIFPSTRCCGIVVWSAISTMS